MNSSSTAYCLRNPAQGAILYDVASGNKINTFIVPATKKELRSSQLAFTPDEEGVAIASDHGAFYVRARKNKQVLDVLRIGNEDMWAQTVAVGLIEHPDDIR
jgi:hypothetical protein